MPTIRFRHCLAALLALCGSQAAALTLQENSPSSGEFSKRFSDPSVVSAGVDLIEGRGRVNGFDFLHFPDLVDGPQSLTFTFVAPEHVGRKFATGGQIYWSEAAFAEEWAGAYLGSFHLDYHQRLDELALSLPSSFRGELWIGMYFTYGSQIDYVLAAPGNATRTPALPAGDPLASLPAPPAPARLLGGPFLEGVAEHPAPAAIVATPVPASALLLFIGVASLAAFRRCAPAAGRAV